MRLILALLAASLAHAQLWPNPGPGRAAAGGGGGPTLPALISTCHGAAVASGGAGAAVNGLDCTGATVIVVTAATFNRGGCTEIPSAYSQFDNQGNVYTVIGSVASSSSPVIDTCLWAVLAPTGTTGFNFSIASNYIGISVAGFTGTATTSAIGTQVGAGSSGAVASIQPGSSTPGNCNSLIIAGFGADGNALGTLSVNSGFTIIDTAVASTSMNASMAYLVQTSIAAVNPTWSITGTNSAMSASIVPIKSADTTCP